LFGVGGSVVFGGWRFLDSNYEITGPDETESLSRESFNHLRISSDCQDVSLELFDLNGERPDFFRCSLVSIERECKFASTPQVKLNA